MALTAKPLVWIRIGHSSEEMSQPQHLCYDARKRSGSDQQVAVRNSPPRRRPSRFQKRRDGTPVFFILAHLLDAAGRVMRWSRGAIIAEEVVCYLLEAYSWISLANNITLRERLAHESRGPMAQEVKQREVKKGTSRFCKTWTKCCPCHQTAPLSGLVGPLKGRPENLEADMQSKFMGLSGTNIQCKKSSQVIRGQERCNMLERLGPSLFKLRAVRVIVIPQEMLIDPPY